MFSKLPGSAQFGLRVLKQTIWDHRIDANVVVGFANITVRTSVDDLTPSGL